MIVSLICDPDVIDLIVSNGAQSRQNLNALLKGVITNGVLVDTPEFEIYNSITKKFREYADQSVIQKERIIWEEICKNKKKHIVRCGVGDLPDNHAALDVKDVYSNLAQLYDVDAIVCSSRGLMGEIKQTIQDSEVMIIEDYLDSIIENTRKAYLDPQKPFDQCDEIGRRDIIRCATRYAVRLEFYDPMIGKGEKLNGFKRGIEYVVEIWLKYGKRLSSGKNEIKIVTQAAPGGAGIPGEEFENKCEEISRLLCEPLEMSGKNAVTLQVMDRNNKFHSRFLKCCRRTFNFERGFDLFAQNESGLYRNFVYPRSAGEDHLREIDSLKTLYLTPRSN